MMTEFGENKMGFLDDLMKQAGAANTNQKQGGGGLDSIIAMAARNPQIVAAILSLLSRRDRSVGGSEGLGGLAQIFQQKGLGDLISSWITTGPNPPVSASQLTDALGEQTVKEFAAKAGVPESQAGDILAALLPSVIDRVTPEGNLPDNDTLESKLGDLLSGFGS
jgi:uncharacterized protein YidB (DUF937 family)